MRTCFPSLSPHSQNYVSWICKLWNFVFGEKKIILRMSAHSVISVVPESSECGTHTGGRRETGRPGARLPVGEVGLLLTTAAWWALTWLSPWLLA